MQTKKLGLGAYIALAIICIVFAAFSSLGIELLFLSTVSTAIFAYLLCVEKLYKVIYIPVLSALTSLLLTQSKIRAVISVLFIVPAIVLTLMIFQKASNTVVIIGLTVCYLVVSTAGIAGIIQVAYGDIRIGFADIVNQSRTLFNDTLAQTNLPELYVEVLRDSVHSLKMTFFGLYALISEVLALLSAMLVKLLGTINKIRVYEETPWLLELSVFGSIILIVSSIATVLFPGEYVAYYVFANLTYILVMFGSFAGVRSMFGKDSTFRRTDKKAIKVFTIIFCCGLLYLSPVFLLIYLSLRGSFFSIGRAIIRRRKENGGGDDNDNDNDGTEE